ncbi:transposase [Microcoleus sp. FACHB-68]|nr:transposase [Microcoleus sp. FACHB-68]
MSETCNTVEEGKEQLLTWLGKADSVYGIVLKTIKNHLKGICNYFLTHTTSAVMEGSNNRLKLIKRQAYDFVNFDNFPTRLLACFSD